MDTRRELVFIDTTLASWEILLAGFDSSVEVVLLNPEQNGLDQIAAYLTSQSSGPESAPLYDAIHIYSHGDSGQLLLGNLALTQDNLSQYQTQLQILGNALTETGDLLLYGCNVAEGETGQSFIEALSQYSGADVAASTDLTGSALLGGDWQLEGSTGSIETASPLNAATQESYTGILAAYNGTAGDDTLIGGLLDDVITGLDGNDYLQANGGNDTLDGGAGNDTLDGGAGDDILTGGANTDRAQYLSALAAVTVDLSLITAQNTQGAGTDTLSGIENLAGSAYNDTLMGDANANLLDGVAGNDTLTGGAGDDTLVGGAGTNLLDGGTGNDSLDGSLGTDTVTYAAAASAVTANLSTGAATGGAGNDTLSGIENLVGSQYSDTLTGDGNANTLEGGAGDDTLDGAAGNDTASYASAAAGVTVSLAAGTSSGAAGFDTLVNFENLQGSAFGDSLTGDINNNRLMGGDGQDTLEGGAGDDTLDGGWGRDTASYASTGSAVTVNLGTGVAQAGMAGLDSLVSIENLQGSVGDDTLTGDNNANVLDGGLGNDTLDGAGGVDTASYASATAGVTVSLAAGTSSGAAGFDTLVNFENLQGSASADTLIGDGNANTLQGSAGDDTLEGAGGNDLLQGGAGINTARYVGSTAGYRLDTGVDGTLSVVDIDGSNGDTGTDRYLGIERLQFDDGTLTISSSGAAEFRVNTYTTSNQYGSAVTALADGGFLVTWTSWVQDGSLEGVYAQRYDAQGNAAGGEFRVNTTTTSTQSESAVTALADGGFVVTWTSSGQDGSGQSVHAQRYDAAGAAAGGEFRVNTTTTDSQFESAVTALADGGFVVTWSSWEQDGSGDGVYAQRYNALGNAQGDEFQVNTYTTDGQSSSAVTALSDGGFVITWWGNGNGDDFGIYAQCFDALGNPVRDEFLVNVFTTNNQSGGAIAALTDGGFVVTWQSYGQDGGWGVFVRRFDALGNALTDESRANTTTSNNQWGSAVSALADGGFVVTWDSYGQDGSDSGVYAQRYDAAGAAAGGEFRVNTTTTDSQFESAVTALADGGFVVTWTSSGQDGSGQSVYAQRYDAYGNPLGQPTITGDAGANAINGGTGAQNLQGGDGNDTLDGGADNDVLEGQADNDVLIGGTGNDTLDGGTGADTASYADATSGVTATANALGGTASGGGVGTDTLVNIENLIGSTYADTLSGDGNANRLDGGAGDDTLEAGAGADTLLGGDGNDTLRVTASGNHSLDGGAGDDTLTYAALAQSVDVDLGAGTVWIGATAGTVAGVENAIGGGVADQLTGDASANRLEGGAGDDSLSGADGDDTLDGGAGNDTLTGGTGQDTAAYASATAAVSVDLSILTAQNTVGASADLLGGIENLTGSQYDDTLGGNTGDNVLDGGAGQDTATYAGAASAVNVSLATTSAQNTVGAGTDTLRNIENLTGSAFDDILEGNSGDNVLNGGAGQDTASYASATGGVRVSLATGASSGRAGLDTLLNFENVTGSSHNDTLEGDAANNTLNGGAGNDTASYANATGAVTVSLALQGAGQNTGNAGNDNLLNLENLRGSAFADTLTGDAGDNVLQGGAGDDTLKGGGGNDVLYGGMGNDTALFSGGMAGYRIDSSASGMVTIVDTDASNGDDGTARLSALETLRFADGVLDLGMGGSRAFTASSIGIVQAPSMAALADGGFVLSWYSANWWENSNIYVQRYDAWGEAAGDAVLANGYTIGNQTTPSVAALESGGFVVTWNSVGQDGREGGIYAQRYEANGAAVSGEFRVHTSSNPGDTFDNQQLPGVAALAGGGFVAVWEYDYNGLYGQRYAADGTTLGGEFQIDSTFFSSPVPAKVAGLADGGFLVCWSWDDGNGKGIYARRYDHDGNASGPAFQVNSTTLYDQSAPAILALADGGFLVSWQSTQGGVSNDIYARRYAADGSPQGEFLVNGATGGEQSNPALAALSDGGFVAVWSSQTNDGYQVHAQRYDAAGATLGSEFRVDPATANGQSAMAPSVTALADGGFLVGWSSTVAGSPGIFAQRFDADGRAVGTPVLTGDAAANEFHGGAGEQALQGGGGDDTLDGAAGNDTLDGGAGSDTADYLSATAAVTVDLATLTAQSTGGGGTDVLAAIENLRASAFNDSLTGDAGANRLDGGAGNDTLTGGAGDDSLTGGSGTDTASYGGSGAAVSANLAAGTASGSAGNDVLNTIENLIGSAFNDSLTGDAGNNTLDGASGNDTLEGGGGDDSLTGGSGTDTASYADAASAVAVNLSILMVQNTQGAGSDTLSGVENLTGSASNDTLNGDGAANVLDGGTGDDSLDGGLGSDTLLGGTGIDLANYAGAGSAVVVNLAAGAATGGMGSDALNDIENLLGSNHNDSFTGDAGANALDGAAGNDTLDGGGGDDSLTGGGGTDTAGYAGAASAVSVSLALQGSAQNSLGAGLDVLAGFENLAGSAFNDTLDGDVAANVLDGADGNDTLDGDDGMDTLLGGVGADRLLGNLGNDRLDGGSDIDTLDGGDGNDTLLGGAGNDHLLGSFGNDSLDGGDDDDTLDGGAGDDVFSGGTGIDTASYASAGAAVTVNLALSAAQNTQGAGMDTLTTIESLIGSAFNDTLKGDANANRLEGGAGNDTLDSGLGADTLVGGSGDDVYLVDGAAKAIVELNNEGIDTVRVNFDYNPGTAPVFTLNDHVENLILEGFFAQVARGNALGNQLTGNLLNNDLDGGAGADTLLGGRGDDKYFVDDIGDVVIEKNSEGTDLVESSVSFVLPTFAENLTLTGTGHINGTGNLFGNILVGNSGDNILDGKGGADVFFGDGGNDVYAVDNAGDQAVEDAGGGLDRIDTSVSFVLPDYVENGTLLALASMNPDTGRLNLTGNDLDNYLIGNLYDNVLDGKGGADTMAGGAGNDTYYVDNVGDVVIELPGEGADLVNTSVTLTTLYDNVENLTLLEGFDIDALGNDLDNVLTGNSAGNRIDGGSGGLDTASYAQASGGVTVSLLTQGVEQNTGAGGLDMLVSIENLTGSAFDDHLTGSDGNNTLDGGAGNDELTGGSGAGDDFYNGGSGSDTVKYSSATTAITVDLTLGKAEGSDIGTDSLSGVENVIGGSGSDVLSGNGEDNRLDGGAGNDRLSGDSGNDTLIGGYGNDVLNGGVGRDVFVLRSGSDALTSLPLLGVDQIADFALGDALYVFGANFSSAASPLTEGDGSQVLQNQIQLERQDSFTILHLGLDANAGSDLDVQLAGYYGTTQFEALGTWISHNGTLVNPALLLPDSTHAGTPNADTLVGGSGDDTFLVNHAGDKILERTGEGIDTVQSWIDHVLTTNLENLVLFGTARSGTGNSRANHLVGNDFANTLDGKGGEDTLEGGLGNDLLNGGMGRDTADYSHAPGAVTVNLSLTGPQNTGGAGYDTLRGIENLSGSDFDDRLTGSRLANRIAGSDGNDTLNGGAGIDTLTGGDGEDTFAFTTSPGRAGADLILDFDASQDRILLDDAVFKALTGTGAQATPTAFTVNDDRYYEASSFTNGHDATDRILYNTSTGALYYDPDGSGSAAAQLVATLQDAPNLEASDVWTG